MKQVRKNMQRAYDDHTNHVPLYICWNILAAIQGRNTMYEGPSLQVQMKEIGGVAERLFRHIAWALRDNGSMKDFIEIETRHFGYQFMKWAGKFADEARLAWLDRIIEMEEIK